LAVTHLPGEHGGGGRRVVQREGRAVEAADGMFGRHIGRGSRRTRIGFRSGDDLESQAVVIHEGQNLIAVTFLNREAGNLEAREALLPVVQGTGWHGESRGEGLAATRASARKSSP